MNLKIATMTIAAALLLGCGSKEQPAAIEETPVVDAGAELHALFDEHFERSLEMNPLRATFIGDNRFNDRLANSFSPEYRAADEAMDREFLERLLGIDRDQLSYQDQLSYDIFRIGREESLEGSRFPGYLQPVNQFYNPMNFFVQLGSGSSAQPFNTVKDYENWLSRADDFVTNVDQMIVNMKEGMQQGIVQPRILMEKVVPQLESQLVEDVTESAFYQPVANMPEDFSDEDRERLTAAYEDKIANTIIPAFARLNNFLGDEYISGARDTVGLYALPNGKEWYEYRVRVLTTTDMTPDEIHRIGLDEVARIQGKMQWVMDEVGFEGSLQDFFDFLNNQLSGWYFSSHFSRMNAYDQLQVRSLSKIFDRFENPL